MGEFGRRLARSAGLTTHEAVVCSATQIHLVTFIRLCPSGYVFRSCQVQICCCHLPEMVPKQESRDACDGDSWQDHSLEGRQLLGRFLPIHHYGHATCACDHIGKTGSRTENVGMVFGRASCVCGDRLKGLGGCADADSATCPFSGKLELVPKEREWITA